MPGARFVDPKVLVRIGNLELLARTVVDGFINGLHRAPFFGASIDFAEHRGYVAGDDIRRVDWRLFARTDRFYVKQYEADTNTNSAVLLDISRSMKFGSRGSRSSITPATSAPAWLSRAAPARPRRRLLNQLSPLRLAWPSLPTMMWSCTAMPSGLATSMICCVIWMSARDGVGSPDG